METSATLNRMGRNKKAGADKSDGGKHQTPRRTVALPLQWYEVAEKLAEKGPTPVVWYLVQLLKEKAEAAGMTDLPPPPWKSEDK